VNALKTKQMTRFVPLYERQSFQKAAFVARKATVNTFFEFYILTQREYDMNGR